MVDKEMERIIECNDAKNGTKYLLHENDERMSELIRELKKIEDETLMLYSTHEVVRKHCNNLDELKKLKNQLTLLKAEKQKACKHKLWYYWSGEPYDIMDPTMWQCRCLDCGGFMWGRPGDFMHVIKGERKGSLPGRNLLSFEEAVREYRSLNESYIELATKNGLIIEPGEVIKKLVLKLNPVK